MSFAEGRKALLADGYKQCINKLYFERDRKYAHYNKLSKVWILS